MSGCSSGGLGVTCSCLSSVEDGVGVSGIGMGCEGFTCGCLSPVEDGVEAAGGRAPVMARAGMAVQYGSLLP